MEITLKDVFRSIKRFICLILAITVIGGAVAGAYTYFFVGVKFYSRAEMTCKNTSVVASSMAGITSDNVLDAVLEEIADAYPEITKSQLSDMISTEQKTSTVYFTITVTSKDSGPAYYICNSLTQIATEKLSTNITGISKAPSTSPEYESGLIRNTAIGLALGFVLSLVISFSIASELKTVYRRSDLEKYFDVDVMGAIPKKKKKKALKLLSVNALDTAFNGNCKKIAVAGVGKNKNCSSTSKAVNCLFGKSCDCKCSAGFDLALSLAGAGKRTVYIDGLNNGSTEYGLNDYLSEHQSKNPVVTTENKNLFVIYGGQKVQDSVELLSSAKMKNLLDILSKQCECIVLDLPGMGGSADAVSVHGFVDGYVLTVKSGANGVNQVNNALGTLHQLSAKVHGIILENAKRSDVFGGRTLIKKYE
ncbi:MAG: hypothetical protein IJX16_00725 [Clostridia bacterium]|nr:hypothetical protein [Clostridia bacterium]